MELRDLLADNFYEFFNQQGEVDPTNRAINLVADWILQYSDYRDEMWADPKDVKLIGKACASADLDDFVAMAASIRINARRYAMVLIEKNSDILNDMYYQQPEYYNC